MGKGGTKGATRRSQPRRGATKTGKDPCYQIGDDELCAYPYKRSTEGFWRCQVVHVYGDGTYKVDWLEEDGTPEQGPSRDPPSDNLHWDPSHGEGHGIFTWVDPKALFTQAPSRGKQAKQAKQAARVPAAVLPGKVNDILMTQTLLLNNQLCS